MQTMQTLTILEQLLFEELEKNENKESEINELLNQVLRALTNYSSKQATSQQELQKELKSLFQVQEELPGDAGGAPDQVHRRHGPPPVHERADLLGRRLQGARAPEPDRLPHPLHHRHAHLLHMPRPH